MDIKKELFDILVSFPALDSPDERKALLLATGFSHLGIYLDWQGSNVEFTTRLLEEFGRRDKDTLVSFLGAVANTAQANVERHDKLVTLQQQVAVLDEARWQREFAVTPPAVARRAPDPAVLTATVVSEILVPYFDLGAEGLDQKVGNGASQLAAQVAEQVAGAVAGDPAGAAIWPLFKQSPRVYHAALAGLLQTRLAAEPPRAQALADLIAIREQASAKGMGGWLNVTQDVREVEGEVIGAIFGADFQGKVNANIRQTIDIVKEGGRVVGFEAKSWPPR